MGFIAIPEFPLNVGYLTMHTGTGPVWLCNGRTGEPCLASWGE